MPIQEIRRLQASDQEEEKMSILLALHCAPILKGSKPANIITVSRKEFRGIGRILRGTKISWRFLGCGDRVILYLYREKELEKFLCQNGIGLFLQEYGYPADADIRECLNRLSKRLEEYGMLDGEFPHEMGIFLGYPLRDVKSFIANKGENYAYVGYWKVYHDVQNAVRLFQRYDRERELAVQEIVMGKTIREVAV